MDKIYTAQEMRNFADAIAGDLNESGHTSVRYSYHDLIPVIESLRQAADSLEREEKRKPYHEYPSRSVGVEREKKYEYGMKWLTSGRIASNELFREAAKKLVDEVNGDGLVIAKLVRREVGEWEEVKDA